MAIIYVNSTWKSGEKVTIDGVEYTVGTDAFTSYSGALSYANANAKNSTIVMMKTTTVSGNCIDQNTHKNLSNLDVVIQDGAVMGNANSKWDMTYAFTVKAGGIFQSARPASAGYGYTHVKDLMTVGEAGADKKAVVDFINSPTMTYKTMCVSILYNGNLSVVNAEFKVGDLGMIGKSEFTDSTIEIAGSISFAAGTQTCSGKHSMTNSTMTVKGHDLRGDNTYASADCNRIANLIMDNSTITVDDGVEGTAADVVELGVLKSGWLNSKKEVIMQNNSKIIVEAGTQINVLYNVSMDDSEISGGNFSVVSGDLTMTGNSALDVAALDIAAGQKISIDNTSSIIAAALTGDGTVEINVVDAFFGVSKVIDLVNNDATAEMLSKITVNQNGYSAIIKDGDIYIATPVYALGENAEAPVGVPASDMFTSVEEAITNAAGRVVIVSGKFEIDAATAAALSASSNVQFTENTLFLLGEGVSLDITDENLTVKEFGSAAVEAEGIVDLSANNAVLGTTTTDAALEISTNDVTEGGAEIRGEVTGTEIKVDNSKNLAVTGSVTGSTIEITNAENAVLDGGNDNYAADFTASEEITFVNDGHAVVDLSAKVINITNNSTNTVTNSTIGYEGDTIVAETVVIEADEGEEGVVSNSKIGATQSVTIADQTVTGTAFVTDLLKVYGDSEFGEDNTFLMDDANVRGNNIVFGDKETSVNASFDATNVIGGNFVVQNGEVTFSGAMSDEVTQGPQLDVGGFIPAGVGAKDNEMGSATVTVAEGANLKTHQVYIGENEAVNEHTLNVYGKLDTTAAVFNKAKGNLNIYGEMNVADQKYFQAAGDVLVSGENAVLNVGGTSTYGIKIGTDEEGLRSSFTIEDGAEVNVNTLVEVGYSTTRNGDLVITSGGSLSADSIVLQDGSTVTIDATGFTEGVYKALDLNMSGDAAAAIQQAVTINGVGENVTVDYRADGDIIFTNVDTYTLYVDSTFAGEYGDKVADGKYYGVNAVAGILDYTATEETTTLNIAGGTYASEYNTTTDVSVMQGNISNVNADGEVIVNVGSLVFETEVAGDVFINGSFTTTDPNVWNTEQGLMPYYNGAIQFKGTDETVFNLDGTFNAAEGFTFDAGKTIISEESVLTVNDQHCGQINVYGEVTNYGEMTVDLQKGSTLRLVNIGNGGSLILSGENASLTTNIVNDQPWAGAQCVDFYIKDGSLVVEDGAKVEASGIVDIQAGGTITVDAASFVTANTLSGAGAITIDATGFEGVKKVIDVNSSTFSGEFSVIGNDSASIIYGDDGDVIITNIDKDVMYVNAAWSGSEAGAEVAEGKYYGVNAFASINDVTDKIATDGSDTTIKFESNLSVEASAVFTYGEGDIIFDADEKVTVKQTAETDFDFTQSKNNSIIVKENVTFEINGNAAGWYQYYGPSLELYGTITGGSNWGCTYLYNGSHNVYSTGTISTGRVHLGFSDINVEGTVDTNYLLVEGSTFTADGGTVDAGVIHDSNNGGMRWGASEFYFTEGSQVTAGSMNIQYEDSIVSIENSEFTGSISNAGSVNITGESTVNANIEGSGAFVIDDAELDGTLNMAWREADLVDGKVVAHTADVLVTGENVFNGIVNNVVEYARQSKGEPDGVSADTATTWFYSPCDNASYKGKLIFGSAEKAANVTLNGTLNTANSALLSGSITVNDGAAVYGTVNEDGGWMNVNSRGNYIFRVGDTEFLSDAIDVEFDGTNPIAKIDLKNGAEMGRLGYIWIGSDEHSRGDNAYVMNIEQGATVSNVKELTTRGDGTINVDGTVNMLDTIVYASGGGTNASDGGLINNNGIINVNETGSVSVNYINIGRKAAYGTAELNIYGGTFEFGSTVNIGYASGRGGKVTVSNGGSLVSKDGAYTLQQNNGTPEGTGVFDAERKAGTIAVGGAADGALEVTGGTVDVGSVVNNGTITVTGESTLVIGDLVSDTSALVLEDADLTASSIAGKKAYINVKGENTYDGTLDVCWIKVGDVDNAEPEYTGSLSFSKDSSVKAAVLQVAAGGSLTYGSAEETFANAFNVSELYAAEDSELTIQNVGAESKISVLFAQGDTVIDNAKIKGHDLVLGNTAGDAEMLIKDSAVTFGGSSNAVVIIGDAAGGALKLENAEVTVNRVGPGSSWKDTTPDVLTVGYKDAVTSVSIDADSTLTVNNGVAISANSTIDLAGTFTATGEIVNAGTVNILGTSASINGSFTNSGMFNIIDAEFASSFTNAEAGVVTIENAAYTGVITNSGSVELNGDVTLSVGAVTGTAATDADGDAVLKITDFTGAGDVIKFAGDLSQIATVNGNAIDYVGDKYTFTDGGKVYYLTETDDQISATEWTVEDIAVTVDVQQAAGTYDFTFTITTEGADATAYTLILDGQEIVLDGAVYTWTGEGYADTLPDSFDYYVVVSGDNAYGKSEEATVDIVDYTAPVIDGFGLSPEGENMFFNFNVSDNRGVAAVELWIDGAKAEDITFSDGKCNVNVTEYAGQEYQVIVRDAAGNSTATEVGVLPEEVLDPAPGEDVIVTPGTTAVTGTIDSEEYIIINVGAEAKLDVIGNIENTDVFNHIIVNDNAELNVSGTVKDNGSLYVAQDAAVNFKDFTGTTDSDNIYIGNDSEAVFENVDMMSGYDTAYVEDVTFSAATVNSLENLNITNGGNVVAGAYTATEDSIVKVGTGSTFAAGSIAGAGKVNLTLGNNASAVVGTATLNKLTVSAGAAFTAGTVTGNGDDVFSFSGNRYAVIEGIAFGDGNDAIVMSRGANLILTGAVTELERISANSSNRIFVTDASYLDSSVAGYNANIVEEINFNGISAGDGKDSLFVLDADETLTLGEAAEVEYYSLTDKTWYTASGDSFSGADISLVKVKDDYTSTATLA